jgi:hypothetical protein
MVEGTEPDATSSKPTEQSTDKPARNGVGAREWLMLGCVVIGLVLAFCVVVGAVGYFFLSASEEGAVAEATPTAEAVDVEHDDQSNDDLVVDQDDDVENGGDDVDPSNPPAPVDSTIEGGDLDVELGQVNWIASEFGSLHVFGEFWNHSDVPVEIREILIVVRDTEGSILESGRVSRHISTTEPDSMVPFVHMFHSDLDDFDRIEVEVTAYEWEPTDLELFDPYHEFDILQASWREDEWSGSIVGEIANAGEESAEFVIVYAAGYGEDGTLTFVETAYVDRDVLPPGSNSPFTILYLDGDVSEPAELRVWAEGWVSEE